MRSEPEYDELLTPAEVAAMFRVEPIQVTRWARKGLLSCIRTPGGHRRYLRAEVDALYNGSRNNRQLSRNPQT
jgi:predicted site-specific integrase-resolvase